MSPGILASFLVGAHSFQGMKLLFSLPKERTLFSSSHERRKMSPYRKTKHVFFLSEKASMLHDVSRKRCSTWLMWITTCLWNKRQSHFCWNKVDEVETSKIVQNKMCDDIRRGKKLLENEKAKSQVNFVTFHQATGICTKNQLYHQWRVHKKD